MSARLTAERLAEIREGVHQGAGKVWLYEAADALLAEIDALTATLERATTKPSVEAGELVELVLTTCRVNEGVSDDEASHAAAFVQRALDAAEERGAEAEREQRDIERRHGVGR